MINLARRILVYLGIFTVLALVALFSWSIAAFPEDTVHPVFKSGWILDNSLILFIQNLLSLQTAAVLAACSLFFSRKETRITLPFHSVISSSLILFLVLAFLFALLSELLLPILHIRNDSRIQKTAIAREYLLSAEEAEFAGKWQESAKNYNLYLAIIPEDEAMASRALEAQEQVKGSQEDSAEPSLEPEGDFGPLIDQTAVELIERADTYFLEENYFSSQYYASRALALDQENLQAKRLIAKAEQKIESLEPAWREKSAYDFHARKVEGHRKLMEGAAIEAYHIFNDLRAENPLDSDVQTFFAMSLEAVRDVSFFIDVAESVLHFPGRENLLFMNSVDGLRREMVFIEKMVQAREGTFLRNIEVLGFSPGGSVEYHFTAPYGEVQNLTVNMLCIDREDNEKILEPEYLEGMRTPSHLLSLSIETTELRGMSITGDTFNELSLVSLWSLADTFSRFGYRPEPVQSEILMRILQIFNFLVLSFFATGYGWSRRNRRGAPPVYTMLLVPLLPLFCYFVITLAHYISRVFFSLLILQIGFGSALIIMLTVEAVLLLLSLFYIAAQRTDEE